MIPKLPVPSAISLCAILLAPALAAQAPAVQPPSPPLNAGDPVLLPGTQDKYDFIRFDAAGNRLLLGHEGNKSFDVFDVATKKLLKTIPDTTSQDAATDVKRGSYYVSGNDPGRMVIVDSAKLEVSGSVPVPSDTDLIAYDPNNGMAYECNDKAGEVWVIDPAAKKITDTIKVDGSGVEDLAFDSDYKHLYQAVKGTNTIAVIDPATNKVTAAWPCAPDKGPHGIAVVPENGLLVACAGKLLLFDRTTGKITDTAVTGERVDEMCYDPDLRITYCASRQGKISVVRVDSGKLTALGDVPDENGTGDITVDPKTHTVWIAYKKDAQCFAQPFAPSK
ncbi:MAG TPA: YncE family protein [Chthoniobacteraceae bacterium]|nr:YncE family protein [Chthoniobacteraceae bacterium]